jgi:hypothetical protein
MRVDADLEAAQQSDDYDPVATLHYWDVATSAWINLNAADQLMEAIRVDLPYSTQAHIDLDNSDGLLDSLDLNGKMIRLGFGSGVYVSYLPYLWGEGWGNGLSMDGMPKVLFAQGPWEKLEGYILKDNHTTFAGDGTTSDAIYQMTIREMIDWVCQEAGLGWFDTGVWTAGLAADISTDTYIETWAPFYIMYAGQNGKQIVKALLELTQCLLVPFEGTFKVKKIDGTEAAGYTYSDAAPHYFESCQHEKHVWKPMKVQVLGPVTYCHRISDTLHPVTAADATDKATFATLAREIKADYNLHKANTGGVFHPTAGALTIIEDLPHKVEDAANGVILEDATDNETCVDLLRAAQTAHEAHRPSTTYHLVADISGIGDEHFWHENPETEGTAVTSPDPVGTDEEKLAMVITLLNEAKADFNLHLSFSGHEEVPVRHLISTLLSFHADTKRIEGGTSLGAFVAGDIILVTGSTLNDSYYTVVTGTTTWIEVAETLADEDAGDTVSILKDEVTATDAVSTLEQAHNLANDIKWCHNHHLASSTYHWKPDTTNTLTAGAAGDLATTLALAAEIKTDLTLHCGWPVADICTLAIQIAHFINDHRVATGVHVVSDTENVISETCGDMTAAIALSNSIKAHFNNHLSHTTLQIMAFANECKGDINAHFIEAGVHVIDDETNTILADNATDVATSYTLVNAVKVGYNAHLTEQGENSGTYTHADWVTAMGTYVWRDIFGMATSDAICLALATAIVLRAELESDKGNIVTQGMNCLQELFDVVAISGDVPGVAATERIGGIRWYWQSLDGYCYQTIQLGGVEYVLQSNDNWMAEDLKLLQEQNSQQATATVPLAPTTVAIIHEESLGIGATVSVDYPVERGYLYMAKVRFYANDGSTAFVIYAEPIDSAGNSVGGTLAAALAGGLEDRSFTFYSGNTAGTTTPCVRVVITNNTGAAKHVEATIMLIKLM